MWLSAWVRSYDVLCDSNLIMNCMISVSHNITAHMLLLMASVDNVGSYACGLCVRVTSLIVNGFLRFFLVLVVVAVLHSFTDWVLQCLYHSQSHRICSSFASMFHLTLQMCVIGLGERSRYSDSLGAGKYKDRIPVWERIFPPVQTGPGTHLASCAMGTESLSRG
jgi:hypothetical protein